MSLRDVKVGDVVTVVAPYSQHDRVTRHPVAAVGRKYFTAGGLDFAKEDGAYRDKDRQGHYFAYSPDMWVRREAGLALRATLQRCGDACHQLANLTDDEVRDLTAALRAAAEKMEKKA